MLFIRMVCITFRGIMHFQLPHFLFAKSFFTLRTICLYVFFFKLMSYMFRAADVLDFSTTKHKIYKNSIFFSQLHIHIFMQLFKYQIVFILCFLFQTRVSNILSKQIWTIITIKMSLGEWVVLLNYFIKVWYDLYGYLILYFSPKKKKKK